MSFHSDHLRTFQMIAFHLGGGWRVDLNSADQFVIYLINPDFRHINISGQRAKAKGRIALQINVIERKSSWHICFASCYVKADRQPSQIAGEIRRRLLPKAAEKNEEKAANLHTKRSEEEARRIFLDAVARVAEVDTPRHHRRSALCDFESKRAGIRGGIDGYMDHQFMSMTLSGLTHENTLKIVCFLSTLDLTPLKK